MSEETPAKSVLETILDWSGGRPLWQQDALRRIVSDGMPEGNSLAEITELCKKEHGAEYVDLEAKPLEASHLPITPPNGASVAIAAIRNIDGVNQLAPDQTLSLESAGLTIIYGPNGSGKSGYGRILKRACRARKPGVIMPDAYDATAAKTAKATFEILVDGAPISPIDWEDVEQSESIMSAISVFDRDCASVQIQGKNEVAYRPFGLDIPDDLANVCVRVKELLNAEKTQLNAKRDQSFGVPTWQPNTLVGKFMSRISLDSNISELKTLSHVADAERVRHSQLTQDLTKDPVKAAAEQRQYADSLARLILFCDGIAVTHSNKVLDSLKQDADIARTLRASANLAANEAFGTLTIKGVGTDPWRALWDTARNFSEQSAGKAFPTASDEPCVLCLQRVSAEARDRMILFESFVKNDTEAKAAAAEQKFGAALQNFKAKKIDTSAVKEAIDRVAISNPELAKRVVALVEQVEANCQVCQAALDKDVMLELSPVTFDPVTDLRALETSIREYAIQLDQAADVDGRKRLVEEFAELTDRIAAEALLPKAVAEIDRLKTVAILEKAIGETQTTAITNLGNHIADNVITPKMRDRFQTEIVSLAAEKVRVEVVRSGGKFGSPQYQVRLFANPTAKVHEVLSEGEQTCVSLAAFLAELATASHQSTLVFDDPVTSLDHRWRKKVADRLVAEAVNRQIIVFTHDMVFVNDLSDLARRAGVQNKSQSLERGPAGTGIITEGLPWRHGRVEARIDEIEKAATAAKKLYEANDEEGYRNEAVRVYSMLRATWERGLEDIGFAGVLQRHRDYIDSKNLRKVVVLEEADVNAFQTGFKKCCEVTDAHDPSRVRDAEVPAPTEIANDIRTLKDWVLSLRDRQKETS